MGLGNQIFQGMDVKSGIKTSKLADLVCTKGFFLYKWILLVPKAAKYQQVCYLTTCLLLVVTCYAWEAWPNATKQDQEKRSFTDVVLVTF